MAHNTSGLERRGEGAGSTWRLEVGDPCYGPAEQRLITRLEDDLRQHMERAKPGRYLHSLSVAQTAEQMALAYGVDPLLARAAGILHDWDKVLSAAEQVAQARRLGVDLGVDLELVQPLLHGMTAARHLPDRYPELDAAIWLGAADMTDLDVVVFVADGIEPRRRGVEAIAEVRGLVDARTPLAETYWSSFYHGVSYVIETQRYLFPGTLDIYNTLALRRRAEKG